MTVADAKFRHREVLVEEVDPCSYLHVRELRPYGFHGKANHVGTDSHAAQQRCFFFLLLRLLLFLGLQREASKANQSQKANESAG